MNITELTKRVEPILKRFGIIRAAVFGSFARGDFTKTSDFDLLVEFPPSASLLDLVGLTQDLESLLKRKVDVVTYDSIHPLLKEEILGEKVDIYEQAKAKVH
jgi:predicted nucleotidyltransferase